MHALSRNTLMFLFNRPIFSEANPGLQVRRHPKSSNLLGIDVAVLVLIKGRMAILLPNLQRESTECIVQYTPPTRLNCRVESRRRRRYVLGLWETVGCTVVHGCCEIRHAPEDAKVPGLAIANHSHSKPEALYNLEVA